MIQLLWLHEKTQRKSQTLAHDKPIKYWIQLEDISIEVTRKAIKTLRLKVNREGGLRASVPSCVSEKYLLEFLENRLPWIRAQQTRLARLPPEVAIDNSPQARRKLLQVIAQYLPLWEQRLGVKASGFGVRAMRTRWGSCNVRTGKIWLSMMLAHRDHTLIEYVLVHELIHLLETRHNARFYALMDSAIPHWKQLHHDLHERGTGRSL